MITRPSDPTTDLVAELRFDEVARIVEARLPEPDDDFIEIVKGFGLLWDGTYWQRKLNGRAGDVRDRAAELGHRLLAAGFPVEFPDEETRDLAVEADYEPECRRWILRSGDKFRIWWRRDEDCYDAATSLTGSHYAGNGAVLVHADAYEDVVTFAKEHGFRFSDEAKQLLAETQRRHSEALEVDVKPAPEPAGEDFADLEALEAEVEAGEGASLLVRPTEPVTILIAQMRVDENESVISTWLPQRHDDFVDVVRAMDYVWVDTAWRRCIGRLAGGVRDRAAELGHRLLAAGFPVEFPDEDLRDRAVDADYEPECRRWIKRQEDEFVVWWGYGENVYQEARRITGSRYEGDGVVYVPVDSFEEVVDFAEMHHFRLTPEAKRLLAKVRRRHRDALVTDVTPEKQQEAEDFRRPTLAAPESVGIPQEHVDFQVVNFTTSTALYPHQQRAFEKLRDLLLGALFMGMGVGKTRTAIELVHHRQGRISNVVWFCPVSLKQTIAFEIQKHTDATNDDVYVFSDSTRMNTLPAATWYVVGIESMSSSDRQYLSVNALIDDHSFVIVDESSYIKGHDAIRTRRITRMGDRARYRLILTGTPLSQGVEDLYAQMRFLSPQILDYNSFYSFAANHLEYHPDYPGLVVQAHNTEWLAAKVQPYVYQVTKDECLDLPDKLFDSRYFRMTNEQHELYEQAKWDLLMSVPADEIDSYVIFQLFGALQQITSGFWNRKRLDGDELIEVEHYRVDALLDVVADIPDGEKAIAWCKYVYSVKAVAGALREEYGEDSVALFYGELSESERNAELHRFRDEDGARFLVATMATGGHGLNLTEAAYAIFYENGFKYAHRIQAEDRIHRIGQDERVTYIDIVCSNSIDTRIMQALRHKENVADAFRRRVERVKDADPEEAKELVKELAESL
jgi:superfamily II DNA or RNA helicase